MSGPLCLIANYFIVTTNKGEAARQVRLEPIDPLLRATTVIKSVLCLNCEVILVHFFMLFII